MNDKLYAIEYYDDPFCAPYTEYIYTDLDLAIEFAISEKKDGGDVCGIVEYEFDGYDKYIQKKSYKFRYDENDIPFIKK